LRVNDYDVFEAVNGREALRSIDAWSPDVVVTDLEMPVMDGFQLLTEIRAHPTHRALPVIVFSTRGSESDTRKAAELGATADYMNAKQLDEFSKAEFVRWGKVVEAAKIEAE
jgi:CheY-like chemotaxis protein